MDDRAVVNPLRISDDMIFELEHNMLLVYTGLTPQSGHIIHDQTSRYERDDGDTLGARVRARRERGGVERHR
jgi:D-glycero-alpha-D-manno-heptose-7-phosphate kinase